LQQVEYDCPYPGQKSGIACKQRAVFLWLQVNQDLVEIIEAHFFSRRTQPRVYFRTASIILEGVIGPWSLVGF